MLSVMLNKFYKEMNKMIEINEMIEIKKKIEEIVSAEYKAYGFEGRAEVTVNSEKVTISLNHEKPYMGETFFKFLETLDEKMSEEYEKTDGNFFFSQYIAEYVRK